MSSEKAQSIDSIFDGTEHIELADAEQEVTRQRQRQQQAESNLAETVSPGQDDTAVASPTVETEDTEEEERKKCKAPRLAFHRLFLLFLSFGLRAWGGPMAQIALLKQELVIDGKWIDIGQFNRVLAVYQALPGPEATELCCYFGYLSRGRIGAVIAGLAFILPGFLLMLLLSVLYASYGIGSSHEGTLNTIFFCMFRGVQPAVASMIFRAVHRIGEGAFVDPHGSGKQNGFLLLIGVFAAVQEALNVPFFITLAVSGILFFLLDIGDPSDGEAVTDSSKQGTQVDIEAHQQLPSPQAGMMESIQIWFRKNMRKIIARSTAVIFLVGYLVASGVYVHFLGLPKNKSSLLFLPDLVLSPTWYNILFLGLLAGLLTFGGAYSAVPLVQQIAVLNGGWLSNQTFLDSLALGQVIPSPLVMFATFVGYQCGGILGAILMTLGIFLPAFGFTLIGHNFFEKIVHFRIANSLLAGITAGVVGLIAVSAISILDATVKTIQTAILFMLGLYAQYQFKHKATSICMVILSGVAGLVLFYDFATNSSKIL